jgi:hypothetical protein
LWLLTGGTRLPEEQVLEIFTSGHGDDTVHPVGPVYNKLADELTGLAYTTFSPTPSTGSPGRIAETGWTTGMSSSSSCKRPSESYMNQPKKYSKSW